MNSKSSNMKTHTREFCEKNGPNWPDFENK